MSETKTGRPSKYHPSLLAPAQGAAATGMTEREIADLLGINYTTLQTWKTQFPEFGKAIRLGKEFPDERVKAALYQSALGFYVTIKKGAIDKKTGKLVEWEETQFIKPEVAAQIFFLKNRRSDEWSDKGGGGDESFENYSDAELAKLVREKARSLVVNTAASKTAKKVIEGKVGGDHAKDVTPAKD